MRATELGYCGRKRNRSREMGRLWREQWERGGKLVATYATYATGRKRKKWRKLGGRRRRSSRRKEEEAEEEEGRKEKRGKKLQILPIEREKKEGGRFWLRERRENRRPPPEEVPAGLLVLLYPQLRTVAGVLVAGCPQHAWHAGVVQVVGYREFGLQRAGAAADAR